MLAVHPGRWYPLGATLDAQGCNFALQSAAATGVELLLFDRPDGPPTATLRLPARTRNVWHGFVEGVRAGQLYGLRVQGPYDPARGHRFNPAKLLVDPWAHALAGRARSDGNLLLGYDAGSPLRDLSLDPRDSSAQMPKAVVIDPAGFDWQGDTPPNLPLESLVIYEVHLKGFTAHPSSGVAARGSYLGFVEKIPYLQSLGINAVELMPVHAHLDDDFLLARGLTNYWGYNTLAFQAPEPRYGSGTRPGVEVDEFRTLVRELHRAGIEVILDVVFNHSAEGSELGPTLSLRGVDNSAYYALTGPPEAPARYYSNLSGCGNTLDATLPATIRLVMDALRWWTEVMHVDGFRFDLAAVLGREAGRYERSGALFDAMAQDPVLHRVKLIAEPWDLGAYELGNFPVDWSEWNGRFRDTVRRFVRGDAGQLPDLGWRLTGSADLYADDGRTAANSINFVTCHDGFTLHDLVAYANKHNDANGEGNRDGSDDNLSTNCGAEGPSHDPAVIALRRQLAKNHLCLLLLSLGTPMLLGGDEFLRTQQGNNNAYCQDNAISWFDWDLAAREAGGLRRFVRLLIGLRQRCAMLAQRRAQAADAGLRWFGPDGGPPRWDDTQARTLGLQLGGDDEHALLLMLHAGDWLQDMRLPAAPPGRRWLRVVDTHLGDGQDIVEPGAEVPLQPGDRYLLNPRSTVVLCSGPA